MRSWEGGEDRGSVWSGSVSSSVMFIPDQSVPVDQEHGERGEECSKILTSQVMRNLAPGKLANASHSHGDGRVEMTS